MSERRKVGIGVDTGGTFTKIVAVTPSGRPIRELQTPTEPAAGPRPFVRRVAQAVHELEAELGARAAGIGLGIAGDVDSDLGRLRFSPNLRKFSHFPMGDALAQALGRRVLVENDANMAAWGGFVVELDRRPRNLVAVTMGTGIGGGLVVEGKLYHGSSGSAGEIGHTRIEINGRRCHCGARGHLEPYAGAYGILRTARRMLRGKRTLVTRMVPRLSDLEPRILAEAAVKGDPVCRKIWEISGTYLGYGIVNLLYVLNPDVVLIVGGVSKAGRLLLDPVHRLLRQQPFQTPMRAARVRIARTPNLGAIGAGLLALE